jgi:hypothetical protein
MATCGRRAVLYITRSVEGTSTSVARERVELVCDRAPGHTGLHRDSRHDEDWEHGERDITSLFRHEEES